MTDLINEARYKRRSRRCEPISKSYEEPLKCLERIEKMTPLEVTEYHNRRGVYVP